jgi:hypothetical protein
MPFSKIDFDWLEAEVIATFDKCALQEVLLAYARAYEVGAWVPAHLFELPAMIKAEIEGLPAKVHA